MKKKSAILIFLFSILTIFSEDISLKINQIMSDKYPDMSVYLTVSDKQGGPILSLVKENFKVFVDGLENPGSVDVAGFQYTDEPVHYTVILSANGLMDGLGINYQQKAILNIIDQLKPNDLLSVYAFGDDIKPYIELQKKSDKLMDMISKVDTLGNDPRLFDVLVFAARKAESVNIKRKVIIIISDGRDYGSKYTRDQTLEVLKETNIPVFTVGFAIIGSQNLYRIIDVSNNSGGEFLFASDLSLIPSKVKLIQQLITQGYRLKIKSKRVKGDDKEHQIEIKVNYKDIETKYVKNFKAPKLLVPLWVKIVVVAVIVVVLVIIIIIVLLLANKRRKSIGIGKRRCPVCKRRMKDDWDECLFCKYLPPKKKKSKKNEEED